MVSAAFRIESEGMPDVSATVSGVKRETWSASSSNPVVCDWTKWWSIKSEAIRCCVIA